MPWSTDRHDRARSLGADVVVDNVGGSAFSSMLKVLCRDARRSVIGPLEMSARSFAIGRTQLPRLGRDRLSLSASISRSSMGCQQRGEDLGR
jgi:NADPH:quinone reductase-like Zn-dependent oxidoreductase